jgi:hypothetical protein
LNIDINTSRVSFHEEAYGEIIDKRYINIDADVGNVSRISNAKPSESGVSVKTKSLFKSYFKEI